PRGFAEIALRRRLDPVGAGAEIDPIEIKLENVRLAELSLEPKRKHELVHLAPGRAFLGKKQVLGELLGNGRAALRDAAAKNIGGGGARKPNGIDPEMAIKAAVFDGDECPR